MEYVLNHSVEKGHLDNHRGCHLDNLEWHHVTAVSAHPLGLSGQWEMSSSLLACWSLQSCLGATCVRSVSYLFSYLRELKLSLTILCVEVGWNTFYFICNSSGQNLHMHFEESLSIEWVLRLMFWKRLSPGQPWTLPSLLPIIIPLHVYQSSACKWICIITIHWAL